jgi:hypothetical protein
MSLATILDDVRERTVWSLAREADTCDPDALTSPGGNFLDRVRDAFIEAIEYLDDPTADEIRDLDSFEYVDSSVPIYTSDLWRTFVDLAAYNEDVSEWGDMGDDLNKAASTALFIIADRLFHGLASDVADSLDEQADVEEITELLDTNPWDV